MFGSDKRVEQHQQPARSSTRDVDRYGAWNLKAAMDEGCSQDELSRIAS